jgi:hypothetical protein
MSVYDLLTEFGGIGLQETQFEIDDHGVSKVRSVDLAGTITYDKCTLVLLIECKHKNQGAKWVFAGSAIPTSPWSAGAALDVVIGGAEYALNRPKLIRFTNTFSWCKNYFELGTEGENKAPPTLKTAIEQLKGAYPSVMGDAFAQEQFALFPNAVHRPMVILSIVVTTAELWWIRPGVRLEHIEQASDLGDVAEERDAIIYENRPSAAAQRHSFQVLRQIFSRVNKDLPVWDPRSTPEDWSRTYSYNRPSAYLVVRYEYFTSVFKQLRELLNTDDIQVARGTPEANVLSAFLFGDNDLLEPA